MPYKYGTKNGKPAVYVKKNGKWVVLKVHISKAKALAHLSALKFNVREK